MLKIRVFSDVTLCRRTRVLVGLENPMVPALFEISSDTNPVTQSQSGRREPCRLPSIYFCQVLRRLDMLCTFCRICFPAPTVHRIADGLCTVTWQWRVISLIGLVLNDLSVEVLISWRSTCVPVTGECNFVDYVICSTEQLTPLSTTTPLCYILVRLLLKLTVSDINRHIELTGWFR